MTRDAELLLIAQRHLNLTTLETRKLDAADFSDQAVWNLKAALQAAYAAGAREGAFKPAIFADAGLLREYLVQHYSLEITEGGAPTTMSRLRRHVRRLADLSRQKEWQTWNHLRGDVERAAGRI